MSKLNGLAAWLGGGSAFSLAKSAQSVMTSGLVSMATPGACGSSCGSGDKGKKDAPTPSACGSGDKEKPKSACGSACGAGGEKKDKPKAACGSSCGAGDKK
jgi:hypothetical protein